MEKKTKKKFYIDMDGTLAIWDVTSTKEETRQPGYFLEREMDPYVAAIINKLIDDGEDVSILTAVYGRMAAKEKREWLDRHGFKNVKMVAVPCGVPKQSAIHEDGESTNVLFDDYSFNLHAWQNPAENRIGIKYRNGINGTNGSWKGFAIDKLDLDEAVMVMKTAGFDNKAFIHQMADFIKDADPAINSVKRICDVWLAGNYRHASKCAIDTMSNEALVKIMAEI